MPSIAGFIQSLLSEDMYATGLLEKTDERLSQLNAGQLRLLLRFVENKIPGLTNTTVLDAYNKLLQKAAAESHKRHEEEVRGERERLIKLKAAHAGVNAKAWDTSHANLDQELAKFQKFLKSKARRVAEEEVLQEEMEKLHGQLLALPERRAIAETKRHGWWALGAALFAIAGPILILTLLPFGLLVAVGAFLVVSVLAAACGFIGVLRGMVVVPVLDDDAIEEKTRRRAKETLKGYRAEVRRTFEATEKIFAADMKWRDEWAAGRKKKRREERRRARKELKDQAAAAAKEPKTSPRSASGSRIVPEEQEEQEEQERGEGGSRPMAAQKGGGDCRSRTSVGERDEEVGLGGGACSPRSSRLDVVGDAGVPGARASVIAGTAQATEVRTTSAPDPQTYLAAAPGRSASSGDACGVEVAATAGTVGRGPGETTSSKPCGRQELPGNRDGRGVVQEVSKGSTSDTGLPAYVGERGPCQGSCLLEKHQQEPELEEQDDRLR